MVGVVVYLFLHWLSVMKGQRLGEFMGHRGRPGVQGWGGAGWPRRGVAPVADVADVAATRGWGGGSDGGGLVLDRYLQIYNTLVKFFLITHLIADFGILANPRISVIRVMAHNPGCIFCIRRKCVHSDRKRTELNAFRQLKSAILI